MNIQEIEVRFEEIRTELEELELIEDFSDDDNERFESLTAEFDALASEHADLVERAVKLEEIRKAAMNPSNVFSTPTAPAYVGGSSAPYGMDNVRKVNNIANSEVRRLAMESVKSDDVLPEVDKQQVRSLIDGDSSGRFARHWVAASSDEYRTGWAKLITGNEYALSSDERDAIESVRAASLTAGSGGYAVPAPVDPTIISTKAAALSPLREIATVKTITNDQWAGISSSGITAAYGAEAAEASDNAPTLVQPTVAMEKAFAFVPASIEITQDWANMASDLAEMFAEAKADLEATEFVTGDGTDAPNGFVTALLAASTTTVVDTVTASVFGSVDVYALQEALPVRHRARASWGANNAIINDIRQFGTSVNHVFTTDLTGGIRNLMERPLYEFSAMDSVVTTNAEPLVFGDFSKFYIVDRVGLTVEYIPHLFGTSGNLPSGQRGFYAYWRNGSNVVDSNAFRILQS